ncbi:phage tail assembly chaperone [Rhodosalinus sp.]|uniref:phage tail assembly chaperone n=1 Tax=Rhodosalinus sp. TaxID=2047741 RepID=UPI003562720B
MTPNDSESLARATQQRLLRATDWIVTTDLPVCKAPWTAYREALELLPQQAGWPDEVVWPEPPAIS